MYVRRCPVSEWFEIGPAGSKAYLALPEEGAAGPGVLVLHAWWGLTETFTDVCDRLAAEGFVALAPSLYPDNATTASISEAEQLVERLNSQSETVEATVLAALDHLRALPEVKGSGVGAIGFSLGSFWAVHLSALRPEDVAAVVSVYGAGDADFSQASAAYLGHFAEHDDYEPLEWVRHMEAQMRAAGREVTFHTYPGTGHWFAEPNRPDAYNPEATALLWERTLAFFKEKLN